MCLSNQFAGRQKSTALSRIQAPSSYGMPPAHSLICYDSASFKLDFAERVVSEFAFCFRNS